MPRYKTSCPWLVIPFCGMVLSAGASQPLERMSEPFDREQNWSDSPSREDIERLELLKNMGPPSGGWGVAGLPSVKICLERGELYLRVEGNAQAALDDAERALMQESDNSSALFLKARSLERLGRGSEAISAYEQLVAAAPTSRYMRRQLINVCRITGELQKARQEVEALLAMEGKKRWENYHLHGMICASLGTPNDLAMAVSSYGEALARGANDTPLLVYVESAEVYVRLKNLPLAIQDYQSAIMRLQQEHGGSSVAFPPEWRLRLAQLLRMHHGESVHVMDCDESNPNSLDSYICQLELAINSIDALRAVVLPSAKQYAFRARAAWEMGQYLRAESDAIRALTLADPKARTQGMGILEMILTVQDPAGVGQLWDHTECTTQCLTMGNRMKGRLLGYSHEHCSDLERQWTGYDLNHDGIVDMGDLMLFPKVVKALEPSDGGGETTPLQGAPPPRVLTETEYK